MDHIQITQSSLLRDLDKAMQQATSDEQLAILDDQELALIDAVSRWAGAKGSGWWAVMEGGRAVRSVGSRASLRPCCNREMRRSRTRYIFVRFTGSDHLASFLPPSPFS